MIVLKVRIGLELDGKLVKRFSEVGDMSRMKNDKENYFSSCILNGLKGSNAGVQTAREEEFVAIRLGDEEGDLHTQIQGHSFA